MNLFSNSMTRRLGLAGVAAIALACLVGCGQGGNSTSDQSVNAQFDKTMHDSCVSSATVNGTVVAGAEGYCSCFVTQLDKLTATQKLALKPDSPEVQQAAATCKAQFPPPATAADANAAEPAAPEANAADTNSSE